jgi:thiol-disulfide isomerase/thioredoxin
MFDGMEADDGESRELAALGRATEWVNSPRLTASALAGKVVLADFCTYTCINWLRTLPYIRAWAEKYRQGLVLIGVHTPEFAFEKNLDNVRRALKELKVDHPIVIDNDYAIWRAFRNNYWPALYFIDARGRVREHHFGEGEYERSEMAIQRLLKEAGAAGVPGGVVSVDGTGVEAAADWESLRSAENYLGNERTRNFSTRPARLSLNQWALAGDWARGDQAIASKAPQARILNRFHARDLHLVMGPRRRESPVRFRVTLDGQPPGAAHGLDVDETGYGTGVEQRMDQLIRQPRPIVERTFEIEFLDAGVEAFAFTFG